MFGMEMEMEMACLWNEGAICPERGWVDTWRYWVLLGVVGLVASVLRVVGKGEGLVPEGVRERNGGICGFLDFWMRL